MHKYKIVGQCKTFIATTKKAMVSSKSLSNHTSFPKQTASLFACHNTEYLPVISMNSTHQDTCDTYVLGPHGQSKFV